jgi:GntR family transcriptional regulator, vanillate catabolism transcriptional regulator
VSTSSLAPSTPPIGPHPIGQGAPLHAQVYEHLWAALIGGDLPPGTRLKDGDWATRLGVSRTPVREAFRKLVQDGALDPQDSVGFRVHAFTSADVLGLYRCRAALEALVAEEAANNHSPGLLSELAENVAAAQHALDAGDLDALQRLNGDFHLILLDASRNRHLRRLLELTGRSVRMARGQVLRRAAASTDLRENYRRSLQPVVDDHRTLYEAVAAGDAARAASAMHNHLLETARDMTLLLRTEEESPA